MIVIPDSPDRNSQPGTSRNTKVRPRELIQHRREAYQEQVSSSSSKVNVVYRTETQATDNKNSGNKAGQTDSNHRSSETLYTFSIAVQKMRKVCNTD